MYRVSTGCSGVGWSSGRGRRYGILTVQSTPAPKNTEDSVDQLALIASEDGAWLSVGRPAGRTLNGHCACMYYRRAPHSVLSTEDRCAAQNAESGPVGSFPVGHRGGVSENGASRCAAPRDQTSPPISCGLRPICRAQTTQKRKSVGNTSTDGSKAPLERRLRKGPLSDDGLTHALAPAITYVEKKENEGRKKGSGATPIDCGDRREGAGFGAVLAVVSFSINAESVQLGWRRRSGTPVDRSRYVVQKAVCVDGGFFFSFFFWHPVGLARSGSPKQKREKSR